MSNCFVQEAWLTDYKNVGSNVVDLYIVMVDVPLLATRARQITNTINEVEVWRFSLYCFSCDFFYTFNST